ncbi:MAG: hypothetical protein FD127_3064 [Acidimicrobiaceae bacterium]|nr:MAG: hypothetical protein FD127_3064 [Acidimicrobiaceae bacterium]
MNDVVSQTHEHQDHEERRPRRLSFVKVLLGLIILALVAMWVYAFGFAPRKAAYRIDDGAWRARAQEICARYEAQRLELVDTSAGYIADPTDAQMIERADIVEAATDILQASLAEVSAVLPASERDQSLLAQYRSYYDTLIADRRLYVEQLRSLDLQPYTESAVDGGPVTNVITDFTIINEMRACAPPGELGGDT